MLGPGQIHSWMVPCIKDVSSCINCNCLEWMNYVQNAFLAEIITLCRFQLSPNPNPDLLSNCGFVKILEMANHKKKCTRVGRNIINPLRGHI